MRPSTLHPFGFLHFHRHEKRLRVARKRLLRRLHEKLHRLLNQSLPMQMNITTDYTEFLAVQNMQKHVDVSESIGVVGRR